MSPETTWPAALIGNIITPKRARRTVGTTKSTTSRAVGDSHQTRVFAAYCVFHWRTELLFTWDTPSLAVVCIKASVLRECNETAHTAVRRQCLLFSWHWQCIQCVRPTDLVKWSTLAVVQHRSATSSLSEWAWSQRVFCPGVEITRLGRCEVPPV